MSNIKLTGRVNGVEIAFIFHPHLGYFEGVFPRQFSGRYNIELFVEDGAGNMTYVTRLEMLDGRVLNPRTVVHALHELGLLNKRL